MKRSLLAGALLTALLLGACGTREPVTLTETDCRTAAVAADFSITLLRNAAKPDKTTLLSPYSVLLALGMAANGAGGRTLEEMDYALGAKTDDLNHWLAACRLAEDGKVVSANSLWTRQELEVRKEFRKTIRKQYDAELHEGEFSMEAVNDWVRKNTKGRIEKILEQDDPMSQACLVNALTFDAEWPVAYTPESVYDGTFFTSDGSRQVVPFLHSVEESYFELAGAEGFVRPYAGERYVFAGLLPAEGTTPEELLQALDGEALLNALGEPQTEEVHVAIPKLIAATDRMQLKEPLRAMGMELAFTDAADFSRLAEKPLKIDSVQHKVWLQLDEQGTQAAAVTSTLMAPTAAADMEEPKTIALTRPFLFVIFDHETQSIVFLGIVNQIS